MCSQTCGSGVDSSGRLFFTGTASALGDTLTDADDCTDQNMNRETFIGTSQNTQAWGQTKGQLRHTIEMVGVAEAAGLGI